MKKLLKRIWAAIATLFNKIEDETKKYVPTAIKVVEGLKKVMDSPTDDVILGIIKHAISGQADDLLIDKVQSVVKEWVPKILLQLQIVNSIANIEDTNAQLQAILAQIKLSSDETKRIVYHGLCSLILEKLSDGKLTWAESVQIAEYYYTQVLPNEKAV